MENPESPNRLKVAGQILALTQMSGSTSGIGLTDPEEIVRRIVKDQRARAPGFLDDLDDNGKNLPPLKQHVEQVWQELEARATEPDESAAPVGL